MTRVDIYRQTLRHFLGPIQPLLDHPDVTEVMVIGPDRVYFEARGRVQRSGLKFPDEAALLAAATNVAEYVGRPIGPAEPTLDARLPDGSRVHVILPPAARQGVCMTIRRFLKASFSLPTLVESGTLSQEAVDLLSAAVRLRKSILISGGTGTGKTSFLNALSASVPEHERIIVIEDSSELQLSQPHTVYLEAQPADDDGQGELTIRDLFVNALRMRPDRIIVGEVRRGEALDLVQSMMSGHPGSLATIHANDPLTALLRLELLSRMNTVPLPADVARSQVALAIDLVVQLERRDKDRRVTAVSEVVGLDPQGQYVLRDLFRYRAGRLEPTGATATFAGEVAAEPTAVHGA